MSTNPLIITEMHRRCVIEATIQPLVAFRRGFARSKAGPFFDPRTVHALVNVGFLRAVRDRSGRHYLRFSAVAA